MLPNPDYAPLPPAQGVADTTVAQLVCQQFFTPENGVACGLHTMARTTVPKAAVYKYGHSQASEYEIWFHPPVPNLCPFGAGA
jgi:hypothetical protein